MSGITIGGQYVCFLKSVCTAINPGDKSNLCILHSVSSQYQYEGQSKSFLAKYEEVELEI